MGVSQGGVISMHLAAKYPELVTKLVLANTAPYANDVIKTVVGTWIDMAIVLYSFDGITIEYWNLA